MEASKIFSKLKVKNYNNELEKIIENKKFSEDEKNLLLSMLYKIENAYNDYSVVKRITLTKKEFIEKILKIIDEKCFEITFYKPEERFPIWVNNEKGKIKCYPNEKSLLSAILYLEETKIVVNAKYEYINNAVEDMIKCGENMNEVEVLRDFNGWSWDIVIKEIDDLTYNLLYQNLLLIYEKKLMEKSIKIKENKDYLNFYENLYKLSMERKIQLDEDYRKKIIDLENEKENQIKRFDNKKEFISNVSEEKKKCRLEIERIDKVLNDKELIKEEYTNRNKVLPNKEKIFSISYLADILEKERVDYIDQIKEYNKILDPREFVKEKERINNELAFLQSIKNDGKETDNKKKAELCQEFLKYAKYQIKNITEKENIIEWIYKIRYYRNIPFDNQIALKDVEILETNFKEVIQELVKKAQELKVWDVFTEDNEISYIIIKELLNSKMINFENISIECKYENGKLQVKYLDGDILEMENEFVLTNVRIKKKIRLFL